MNKLVFPVMGLALAGIACGAQPAVTPTRNLERPSDMDFVCLDAVLGGQPMGKCHPPKTKDPVVDVTGDTPRTLGTFALVTNTARNEVSVIDLDKDHLVDLDPRNPGFNMLPVGTLPGTLSVSPDGCFAVTANAGSCDLTVIDPARLLANQLGDQKKAAGPGPVTSTMLPRTKAGRVLRSVPYDVKFLPRPADGEAGSACAASSSAAAVTFPACDLVVLMDVPSGQIEDAVYIRAGAIVPAGDDPSCPAECGETSAGAAIVPLAGDGLRVGPMALLPDGKRLYVGGINAPFVAAIDIDLAARQLVAPAGTWKIALHDRPLGTTRLRLSVIDPVGEPGFLYAFARDGSVRVIHAMQECDLTRAGRLEACPPISGDPGPLSSRLPLAQGSGLRIPVQITDGVSPPVPIDIAFASLRTGQAANGSNTVDEGDFGYLLASNGRVYVINIDAVARPAEMLAGIPAAPHSFRDANAGTTSDGLRGPPRLSAEPSRTLPVVDLPFPTRANFTSKYEGPRLETLYLNSADKTALSWVTFPGPSQVTPQTWSMIWEAILPGTGRISGIIESPPAGAGPGAAGAVVDAGANLCEHNVTAGDIVNLPGCLIDTDCSLNGTSMCYAANPGGSGMCFPRTLSKDENFIRQCGRHLGSRRRYEVRRPEPGRLELGLKLDEVPKPSIHPCEADADCQPDQDHKPLPGGVDKGFQCVPLWPNEPRRCVKRCTADRDCRPGHVCEIVKGAPPDEEKLCVEAPRLDARCFPEATRYRVQAGRSFVVFSSGLPLLEQSADVGGTCTPNLKRHPLLASRIPVGPFPLAAGQDLHCARDKIPDGKTTATAAVAHQPVAAGAPWGNPCFFEAPNADEPPGTAAGMHVKALFGNPQLRFVMTNLEQFTGDATSISFEVIGGFRPEIVSTTGDASVTVGSRILTGPTKTPESPGGAFFFPYIYAVDQGRASTGTRGQILRINPRTGTSGIGQPRFDSSFTKSPYPIQ